MGGYCCFAFESHQTDRFAAAINFLGIKWIIISFLGDSPKIGTRNYAAARKLGQASNIGGSLWDEPLKYIATSGRITLRSDSKNSLTLIFDHIFVKGIGKCLVHNFPSKSIYAMRRIRQRSALELNYLNGGHVSAGAARMKAGIFLRIKWNRNLCLYEKQFLKNQREYIWSLEPAKWLEQ